MDREKFVEKIVKKYSKIFRLKRTVEIKKDNRMGKKIAGVNLYRYKDNQKLFYLIKTNFKVLNRFSKIEIIHIFFHELGHAKLGHLEPKINQSKNLINKEYQAEKFALKKIKKYYPKYYNRAVKSLDNYIDHDEITYAVAFAKLRKELHEKI